VKSTDRKTLTEFQRAIYLVNSIGRLADEELGARKVAIAYAFLDFLVERFNDAPWREPCALDRRL
jgi:hypothetical protein